MALSEGDVIEGKYRILRLIGKGGMGTVWVAENLRVHRQVAIKVLTRGAIEAAGDALLRFEREAQAAGKIGSDHIVEVLDLGSTADGDRFMVMEYLEGDTLKQRMRRGRLDQKKTVEVFCQLLEGLTAAHAAGIIHRDVKPDNIFLQREKAGHRDWVKILDFGISKFSQLSGDEGQVTRAGMVMGTPFYMSPEQARTAHAVDARSDLYSTAVMLFETLTGQVPFSGATFAELLFKIAFEPQPHPKTILPTLDDDICAIILKGMERDPAARYQTAAEFAAALTAWGGGHDVATQPARPRLLQTIPIAPRAHVPPAAVVSHGLLAPPPPALMSSPTIAFPQQAPAAIDPLQDGATQHWASDSAASAVVDPASTPELQSFTQKSWDGTVPTPTLPVQKGLAPVIIGAFMTVCAAAALAIFLLTRPVPGAPTEAGNGVAIPIPIPTTTAGAPPPATATSEPVTAPSPSVIASAAPSASQASTKPTATPRVVPIAAPPAPSGKGKKPGQVVTDYGY
jgi:serine/threonine-protein kinase